jgi:hypothetical protein
VYTIFVYKSLSILGNNFVLPEILLLIGLDCIRLHTNLVFKKGK